MRIKVAKYGYLSGKATLGQNHSYVFVENSNVDDNAIQQNFTQASEMESNFM